MAIRNLNKAKCKDEGDTNAVVCPSCGEETAMRLIKAEDSSFLPKLLDKPAEITFAVCPK